MAVKMEEKECDTTCCSVSSVDMNCRRGLDIRITTSSIIRQILTGSWCEWSR